MCVKIVCDGWKSLCGLWETKLTDMADDSWGLVHTHAHTHTHSLSPLKYHSVRTCKCDVKASVCVGVVSQELQPGHMGAGCYRWGQDVSGKGTQDGRLSLRKTSKDFLTRPKVSWTKKRKRANNSLRELDRLNYFKSNEAGRKVVTRNCTDCIFRWRAQWLIVRSIDEDTQADFQNKQG